MDHSVRSRRLIPPGPDRPTVVIFRRVNSRQESLNHRPHTKATILDRTRHQLQLNTTIDRDLFPAGKADVIVRAAIEGDRALPFEEIETAPTLSDLGGHAQQYSRDH